MKLIETRRRRTGLWRRATAAFYGALQTTLTRSGTRSGVLSRGHIPWNRSVCRRCYKLGAGRRRKTRPSERHSDTLRERHVEGLEHSETLLWRLDL